MKRKKPVRLSHKLFLAFVAAIVGFLFVANSNPDEASAEEFIYEYRCGDFFDCWVTTECEPVDSNRTESYYAQNCKFTDVEEDFCVLMETTCFDVYSCPENEFLGTVWEDGHCFYMY